MTDAKKETPGRKVLRLRTELKVALRELHSAEGHGRADEPELFRSARVWHFLRNEGSKRPITPREVALRVYGTASPEENTLNRRAASAALRDLEQRGLAARNPDAASWSALRTTPTSEDRAALASLVKHAGKLRTGAEVAAETSQTDAEAIAALRRLSLLGLAVGHMRGGVVNGACVHAGQRAWRLEASPFAPSAVLFGLASAREGMPPPPVVAPTAPAAVVVSATTGDADGAITTPKKYANKRTLDLDVLPKVYAVLPPPQGAPLTTETVAMRAYGADSVEAKLRAVRQALRSLRDLGLVVGSQTTNQWVQRVRGPSEHDELVLAALDGPQGDDGAYTETEVIAAVWPEATAEQATAVMDSLRRLRMMGLAVRVKLQKGLLKWRRAKGVQ